MRHKYFHRENHKGENPANFFRIVSWSKVVITSIHQIYISYHLSSSLSHSKLRMWGVYKWGRVPPYLYPFKSLNKHNTGAHMSSMTGLTSPKETPNTHYMMLHWGLLPPLTTKVVPQGLDTIKTSCKEVNTSGYNTIQR